MRYTIDLVAGWAKNNSVKKPSTDSTRLVSLHKKTPSPEIKYRFSFSRQISHYRRFIFYLESPKTLPPLLNQLIVR